MFSFVPNCFFFNHKRWQFKNLHIPSMRCVNFAQEQSLMRSAMVIHYNNHNIIGTNFIIFYSPLSGEPYSQFNNGNCIFNKF